MDRRSWQHVGSATLGPVRAGRKGDAAVETLR